MLTQGAPVAAPTEKGRVRQRLHGPADTDQTLHNKRSRDRFRARGYVDDKITHDALWTLNFSKSRSSSSPAAPPTHPYAIPQSSR